MEQSDNNHLLKMIQGMQGQITKLKQEQEELTANLANNNDTLPECQELIQNVLDGLEGEELVNARASLRGMIRGMVARITLDIQGTQKAGILVEMANGKEIKIGDTVKIGPLQISIAS